MAQADGWIRLGFCLGGPQPAEVAPVRATLLRVQRPFSPSLCCSDFASMCSSLPGACAGQIVLCETLRFFLIFCCTRNSALNRVSIKLGLTVSKLGQDCRLGQDSLRSNFVKTSELNKTYQFTETIKMEIIVNFIFLYNLRQQSRFDSVKT